MMRRSLVGLVFFLAGCMANTEGITIDNQIDVSGLKHHYTQNCDGVKVNVFYAPKVEIRNVINGGGEDFDLYRIQILPVAHSDNFSGIEYFRRYGEELKIFEVNGALKENITAENIDILHVEKPNYVDAKVFLNDSSNIGKYYYAGLFISSASKMPRIGHYEINIDGTDMFKINGVPCSINIPNIPIEVVPDGTL